MTCTKKIAQGAALALGSIALVCAPAQAEETEAQMGSQVFAQLKSQGEIVQSTPLYRVLAPLAVRITRVVQPNYAGPIHFYIVHETQPNAFAAPGGNVYVTDSLFYFVKNTEELAGTICHETSHLLHHDSLALMKRKEAIRARAIAATIILGPSARTILAASALGQLDELHYSREAEENADLTGADTCAAAGYNPWGLVWLFNDFSHADMPNPPEILSNHPDFAHRVAALENHFAQHPVEFGGFDSNPRSATRIAPPNNEEEKFLR
ncbi:MAG TPA: M48 family metallopeptidase [Candidatus Cybelea sp.]|jgi:predicted Zn-dependent protease